MHTVPSMSFAARDQMPRLPLLYFAYRGLLLCVLLLATDRGAFAQTTTTDASSTTVAPAAAASATTAVPPPASNATAVNATTVNETAVNTTTAPTTVLGSTTSAPGATTGRPPRPTVPATPVPPRPTAQPNGAVGFFPVDTAAAGSALTRMPGATYGWFNSSQLVFSSPRQNTPLGRAGATFVMPEPQTVLPAPASNATNARFYNEVDVIFATFSESRTSSYLASIARAGNVSLALLQTVNGATTGRVSLEFGSRFILSLRVLSTTPPITQGTNETHRLAFALAANISRLALQPGSELYRFTVLYAKAVYPVPYQLLLVPVGINYMWMGFVVGGVACCAVAVLALCCRTPDPTGSSSAVAKVAVDADAVLGALPPDAMRENRDALASTVEKLQRQRMKHLIAEAEAGKSLLGAAAAERAMVAGALKRDENGLFLRNTGTMPVVVLLEHDRLFQLPPQKKDNEKALKRLATFSKMSRSVASRSDGGGGGAGSDGDAAGGSPGRHRRSSLMTAGSVARSPMRREGSESGNTGSPHHPPPPGRDAAGFSSDDDILGVSTGPGGGSGGASARQGAGAAQVQPPPADLSRPPPIKNLPSSVARFVESGSHDDDL